MVQAIHSVVRVAAAMMTSPSFSRSSSSVTRTERVQYLAVWVGGVAVTQWVFTQIGAGWPAPRWYYWCDAWIFIGSMIATYAMARGWNDFWLAWIAVDLVGVPLLP